MEETTSAEGSNMLGHITRDDPFPFAGGISSNIYRGKLVQSNGQKIHVAIKMFRPLDDSPEQQQEILRRMQREAKVWSQLKHKNILTFIGVYDLLNAPWPVLVSPYHKLGNIKRYIGEHPKADRNALVLGVACGLQFLHENNVVHGDLKAQNIVVDEEGIPCICDFGISKIVNHRGFTTASVGTVPYMAPELFHILDGPAETTLPGTTITTTMSSDVYSFALLILEILTGQPPKRRPTQAFLMAQVVAELHPTREDYEEELVSDTMWAALVPCWAFDPNLRPGIPVVHDSLREIFSMQAAS
ncbi:kinase-like domain-containing protein [Mycena amicta]|nr:kinase-like domain-containing protein [Mycena amicta]